MNIRKWLGLVTAASPYTLPPGAASEQNNLQLLNPGQLVPRPGMSPLPATATSAVVALYRQAPGGSEPDRLVCLRLEDIDAGDYSYSLQILQQDGQSLASNELAALDSLVRLFPSFAQDRHGTLYAFYGHGIRPQTYRHTIDSRAIDFGLTAPTVAPAVTPEGDGWFIERVDVLSSGTSYYTPPTLTVSGGSPDRNAQLRAVIQAGAIVAVEVVDGGSNFKGVPSIAVSDEQVGTGFLATGILGVAAAVYGFRDSDAPASSSGSLTTGNTHSFDLSNANPKIAYKTGSSTAFVSATFNPISAEYVALVPLTASSGSDGTGAFAEVKFNPLSAAYQLGNVTVAYQTGATEYDAASGTAFKFRASRTNWYIDTDYFQNNYTPVNRDYTNSSKHKYHHLTNKDGFWGLMPNPSVRKFAKRQISRRWWESGDIFSSGSTKERYANYFYPDYSRVGYRLLVGPEDRLDAPANWVVGSAAVQVSGGRPYIDIPLQPAKKTDGTSRQVLPGTVFPTVRIFLMECPEAWSVENTPSLLEGSNQLRRFTPQSGQDRRANLADTGTNRSSSSPSGVIEFYSFYETTPTQRTNMDGYKRWWNAGHVNNGHPDFALARPLVDIRTTSAGNTPGLGAGSIELVNRGGQLEQGTKFVVRLEQYNSFDYEIQDEDSSGSWGSRLWQWLTAPPTNRSGTLKPTIPATEASFERKTAFNDGYIDFYFEANAVDTTTGDPALLLPGAVKGTPKVILSGSGWGSGQFGEFVLRQQAATGGAFSDSVTYRWNTDEIIPAVSGSRIESVVITSQGQNYYREPTILFRGGGGYGLRVQSTVAGGRVTAVVISDGGDGFTSDTVLYTDVQPAKLLPILRGTMRGMYRCAYRFADYRQTVVRATELAVTSGSKVVTLLDATDVAPGMQITGVTQLPHLTRIVSISGNTATLSHAATATASNVPCVIRDMTRPITYSDFSPIADVDASANSSGRAARLRWSLVGVTAPPRAEYVEFYRTSADQSLVFYRLEQYGTVSGGVVTIVGQDGLSDEELFDIDRPAYAALPVVLPNGGLNAYRFGTARSDMAACVAWEDRLWYGVSTSGKDSNTVFFSELDEFESCPDLNELPIQANLRASDFLTALVPFGPVLLAMQNAHCYSVSYNTDPSIDPVVTLAAHRGCLNQRTWDIYDDLLYAADERGVYSMSKSGEVRVLAEPIRDLFSDGRLDLAQREAFHLRVDQSAGILRLFVSLTGANATNPHIALCYHIRNEAWWTESWPNSLLCSSDYRPAGRRETEVYGAIDGGIYEMDGLRDYPFGDILSVTVADGGSGYITPPTVSLVGDGRGAELRALLVNGQVSEVLVVKAGFGYGEQAEEDGVFDDEVTLVFSPPPSGTTAAGYATARAPAPALSSVPFSIRTGAMALAYEGSGRGGDRQMDRSITVTYRPTAGTKTLVLREYYNNASSPRPNVMRRDRGTGFVHDTDGAKTTLDMDASRSPLGLSTGLAKAMFAGRSLEDVGSADRHIAIELSCDAQDATAAVPPEPLIYELDVQGVVDGGQ